MAPSISHSEAATGAPGVRGQAAANGRRSASSSGARVRYCEPAALLLEPSFAPAGWSSCLVCMPAPITTAKEESAQRMQGSTPYHAYACLFCIAGRLRIARLSPQPLLTAIKPSDHWNERGRGFNVVSLHLYVRPLHGPLLGKCMYLLVLLLLTLINSSSAF